jgi:predicted outer membrane lipoprotein
VRLALWVAGVLTAVAGVVLTTFGLPLSALALTLTVSVGIINALWLERLFSKVLQPGRARFSKGAVALLVARLALWGLLFAVLFLLRRHIQVWVVAVGVAIVLCGLATVGWRGEDSGSGKG